MLNKDAHFIQVQLDESIMNKNAFLSQKKKVVTLKELISLLPRNLARDDLMKLHKEMSVEVIERTSMICEMIPDDIWKSLFQLMAYNGDISEVFPMKQVCKRWQRSFPSSINEARIQNSKSLKQIYSLKSLRSLTIETEATITQEIFRNVFIKLNRLTLNSKKIDSTVPLQLFRQMTNLTALDLYGYCLKSKQENFINNRNISSLTNLEYLELKISDIPYKSFMNLVKLKEIDFSRLICSRFDLESTFGPNLDIINHLKNLKIFSIYRTENDFIGIDHVQKLYPHVRFRWLVNIRGYNIYYEGSFSEDNKMSGKGKLSLDNRDFYMGEFKNDMKEGMGTSIFPSGVIHQGEYKNNYPNGQGVRVWPKGQRFEGQFKEGRVEGKGVHYWSNGDRLEGEFKNHRWPHSGSIYYANGGKYTGDCRKGNRGGKGTMFYLNGNRYEGIFAEDKRVGKGVFYYSNGDKVEGESKFLLNDQEGTIEILHWIHFVL